MTDFIKKHKLEMLLTILYGSIALIIVSII